MSNSQFFELNAQLVSVFSDENGPAILINIDDPSWPYSEGNVCLRISASNAVNLGRSLLINFDEELKKEIKS
ncbi:hypothetical protein IFU02_020000 [Pantoea agglomerans]|uniref:hypothetical protein n=1 Tax=Enterobacter agglomerans TaxID=549 RepID=UPI00177E67E9|nr:hypothetical protein [Pantoea agglomerans]WVL84727.1 hypothetical protein IFU02_020000 [Pantoea agglomerans]